MRRVVSMRACDTDVLKVSVVMSVFDKPADVKITIESVLAQVGVELEFIIVNDGAHESVLSVLRSFDDSRIKVISQVNQGLTLALINGCSAASHECIARVDAGDQMMAGRLKNQAECLRQYDDVGMVCCWVKIHTDEGVELYDVTYTEQELLAGLSTSERDKLRSPVHASVMFRKSFYELVGGYRKEFYFTQDCDLWARLVSVSKLRVIPEFLQRALYSPSGISGRNAESQRELANLIVEANELRAKNKSDDVILSRAQQYRPIKAKSSENTDFAGNYFIASILSNKNPRAAATYWLRSLKSKPWHVLVWLRLLKSLFNSIYR